MQFATKTSSSVTRATWGAMMGGFFGQTPGTPNTNAPYGMMNGYGWNGSGFSVNSLLLTLLLAGLVVAVSLWILKLWQDLHPKSKSGDKK
ncbi:hypothetical protein HY546_01565 [archaeon]|nr:hypothetical protein [archaeon]